jgi:hypothetical protein
VLYPHAFNFHDPPGPSRGKSRECNTGAASCQQLDRSTLNAQMPRGYLYSPTEQNLTRCLVLSICLYTYRLQTATEAGIEISYTMALYGIQRRRSEWLGTCSSLFLAEFRILPDSTAYYAHTTYYSTCGASRRCSVLLVVCNPPHLSEWSYIGEITSVATYTLQLPPCRYRSR